MAIELSSQIDVGGDELFRALPKAGEGQRQRLDSRKVVTARADQFHLVSTERAISLELRFPKPLL